MSETVTRTAQERITVALGRMPYLPMSDYYSTASDPETLAVTLEAFSVALARIADEHETEREELRQLRSDIESVRRVFGAQATSREGRS